MTRALVRLAACAAALPLLFACAGDRHDGAVHASGHVEATEVRLAATVGGRLLEAPFEEGDRVETGAVVARLDTSDAERELARARAQADAAEAQLRLLQAGSRSEDVRRAREQLGQAGSELEAAARDLERLEGLAERGTATRKAADDARTRRDVAARSVEARRAELDRLIAGPRREEIEAARAQYQAALASAAVIEKRIADATLASPSSGVLTDRIAEPGEVLSPGAPIAIITDLERPWLDVYVDEPNLARIRLGEQVEIRLDGVADALAGTVAYISPVAEFTPKNVQTPEERAKLVYRVKIALDNGSGVFKPGMPADAFFPAQAGSADS